MIKQDYLLRLIQEVMRAISMILHGKKNEEEKQKELDKCYQTFLGKDKTFFLSKNLEELTHTFSEEPEANQMMKLEALATIMEGDAQLTTNSEEQYKLTIKALYLLEYVSQWERTYSIERELKIMKLKRLCAIKE